MPSFHFPKEERLKSKKKISWLFQKGNGFNQYPIRIIWIENESESTLPFIQAAFSVPKRKFPKAVDRNLLKRRMREAYRLNKGSLTDQKIDDKSYSVMFLFIAKKTLPYSEIETNLQIALKRWIKKVS